MNKGDRYSHTYTVNEPVYQAFIYLFNDKNPLHTSSDYAKKRGFNERVMHGNILNGFLSHFIGEGLPEKNVIIQKQEIRYYHPVYLNDTLELQAEVAEVFESVHSVEIKYYFQNPAGKKVAKGVIQIGMI